MRVFSREDDALIADTKYDPGDRARLRQAPHIIVTVMVVAVVETDQWHYVIRWSGMDNAVHQMTVYESDLIDDDGLDPTASTT
jgi:hypothetical protein